MQGVTTPGELPALGYMGNLLTPYLHSVRILPLGCMYVRCTCVRKLPKTATPTCHAHYNMYSSSS